MKISSLAIFFSVLLISASPGWAEGVDYKTMILEFEKFRSTYHAEVLKKESGQMEPSLEPPNSSAEVSELQRRWDQLVGRIYEKESFFSLDKDDLEEMRVIETSQEAAINYLQTHPGMASFMKVAYVRNLHLQSVKKELESRLESYSQVTQLEDVLSQFSSFIKELDIREGPRHHQTSIMQSYPFPGALTLKANIAGQEVRIAKADYEIALRDMVTQVKEAFYDWAYLSQAIRITEEHLKLLKDLETVASVHFRTGKGGFNDIIKAQIKIFKLKDDLINLKEEYGVVKARLTWFLNLSPTFSIETPPSDTFMSVGHSEPELNDMALNHQQELNLLSEEITKSRMAIELAEKKYYPDLSPGFSYFEDRKGAAGNGEPGKSFESRPDTKPEYWFGENDAFIREAKMHHESLLKNIENHKQGLRYAVKQILYELDKSERAVALYGDSLLPLAQKALEVSIAEYKTGRTDFLSLLDAETTLLNFGIDYQGALKNHGQNKARLEKLIGIQMTELEVTHEPAK